MKIPQTKRYADYKKLVLQDERSYKLNFKPDGRKHYVYRITDLKRVIEENYYGSRTSDYEDIMTDFWSYKTSSKYNELNEKKKEDYKIKLLKIFDNPGDKICYEAFLHQYFNVKPKGNSFWNRSNQTPFGFDMTGTTHSQETKDKMSLDRMGELNHNYGKHHSQETREKISDGNKGKKLSKEHKLKISKASTGKLHTEETKKKISESHTGKKFTEEHKKNIGKASKGRQANLGNKHSNEAKKKISDARKASKGTYKISIIKCPHCNKEGGSNNMKRWHFDNCKFK